VGEGAGQTTASREPATQISAMPAVRREHRYPHCAHAEMIITPISFRALTARTSEKQG
jgi:hypothetical protein